MLGAGGLGSPSALYLAAAGVGTIGIVDMDEVDASNLQRQILHNLDRVGDRKVDSAKKTLTMLNPDVDVVTYDTRLDAGNILDIIAGVLLILLRYDDVVQADGEAYWITLWGAAMILLGLLTIAMASGLTRGRNSARIFVTVLLSISLVLSVVDVVVSPTDVSSWWSLGIGGLLSALVILALWAGRSAEFFRRSRALPAA